MTHHIMFCEISFVVTIMRSFRYKVTVEHVPYTMFFTNLTIKSLALLGLQKKRSGSSRTYHFCNTNTK